MEEDAGCRNKDADKYAWLEGLANNPWIALLSCRLKGGNEELGAESPLGGVRSGAESYSYEKEEGPVSHAPYSASSVTGSSLLLSAHPGLITAGG